MDPIRTASIPTLRSMASPGEAPWSMQDIPYAAIEHDRVADDVELFYILASASFVEITSDLYTRNLVEYFRDDADIVRWLEQRWEKEELQHGAALKRYVETAWPDFDWDSAYRGFYAEYLRFCSVELFAGTRALEMAARCVVETGTATFYSMLADSSPEPVLTQLVTQIRNDEVRHYKYFYHYFLRYRDREHLGRSAVLRALLRRVNEIDSIDGYYAFKHAFLTRNPRTEFHKAHYVAFRDSIRRLARRHYPNGMAVKMLLKPLGLSPKIGRMVSPAMIAATRLFLLKS